MGENFNYFLKLTKKKKKEKLQTMSTGIHGLVFILYIFILLAFRQLLSGLWL